MDQSAHDYAKHGGRCRQHPEQDIARHDPYFKGRICSVDIEASYYPK
jgi:hypothetical protein